VIRVFRVSKASREFRASKVFRAFRESKVSRANREKLDQKVLVVRDLVYLELYRQLEIFQQLEIPKQMLTSSAQTGIFTFGALENQIFG
jgi:hypothetical protein